MTTEKHIGAHEPLPPDASPDMVVAMRESNLSERVRLYAHNLHAQVRAIYDVVGVTDYAQLTALPRGVLFAHAEDLAKLPGLMAKLREALGQPDVAEHRVRDMEDAEWYAAAALRLTEKAREARRTWNDVSVEIEATFGELQLRRLLHPEVDPDFVTAHEQMDALYGRVKLTAKAPGRMISAALRLGDMEWAQARAEERGTASNARYLMEVAAAFATHGEADLGLKYFRVALAGAGADSALKAKIYMQCSLPLYMAAARSGRRDIVDVLTDVAPNSAQRDLALQKVNEQLHVDRDVDAKEFLFGKAPTTTDDRYYMGEDTVADECAYMDLMIARSAHDKTAFHELCRLVTHMRRVPEVCEAYYQKAVRCFASRKYPREQDRIGDALMLAATAYEIGKDPVQLLEYVAEEIQDLKRSDYDRMLPEYALALAKCHQVDAARELITKTKDTHAQASIRYQIAFTLLLRGNNAEGIPLLDDAITYSEGKAVRGYVENEMLFQAVNVAIKSGREDLASRALALVSAEEIEVHAEEIAMRLSQKSMSVSRPLEGLLKRADQQGAEYENGEDAWRRYITLSASVGEGDDYIAQREQWKESGLIVKDADITRWLWEAALSAHRRATVLAKIAAR